MKNILIAVNSFKECADAVEVSGLFNKYLDKSLFKVIQKPISDGGDGFLEICRFNFRLEILSYPITTPYDDSYMDCRVGLDRNSKTIYIESAEVLGMRRISAEQRHPLLLSSKGLGDLLHLIMQDVEELKFEVNKVIIGIGGTATMDLGLGMCSRFGLKLFDVYNSELDVLPENFHKIADVEYDPPELPFSIEAVLDVKNSLLGKNGGIIYGSQKGASKAELEVIELGWNKAINTLYNNALLSSTKELSGAGGGLPVGLKLFRNSTEKHADDFISNELKITINESLINMVVTGEGTFDEQSLMGKGAGFIISIFEKENIPVVLCCGKIDKAISDQLSMNVFPIELQTFVLDSINNFEEAVKIACDEISGMTDILTKIY